MSAALVIAGLGAPICALGESTEVARSTTPVELQIRAPWLASPVPISIAAYKGGLDTSAAPIVTGGDTPGILAFALEPGSWNLIFAATDAWAPTLALDIEDDAPLAIEIEMLPAGRIVASLTVDAPGKVLPHAMIARLRLRDTRDLEQGDEGPFTFPCPVDSEKKATRARTIGTATLRCTIPAGAIDLRLEVPGFVPHYVWDLDIEAGQETQLGEITLRTGSSLVARVERDDGLPAAGAEARLLPAHAGRASTAGAIRRSEQFDNAVSINEFGFFQVAGLPPGAYALTITLEGYGRVVEPLIMVPTDTEVVLDPALVVPYLPSAEVALTPTNDPSGAPWTVILTDPLGTTEHSQTDNMGLATFPVPKPGRYLVMVMTADGESYAHREVTLDAEGRRVDIAIESITVEGVLTLADEPLEARLYFGGTNGVESVRLRSDDEGRFAGTLPRLGDWSVDIVSRAQSVERKGIAVVAERDDEGVARIEIDLPAAGIEGRVIGADGEAVEGATVLAIALGVPVSPPSPRADDDGRFALRGIEPGRYRLQAFKVNAEGRASSPSVDVEIEAANSIVEVELVLGGNSTQRGAILDPHGRGIPGVSVEALLPPGASVILPRTTTDADGSFSLSLPPELRDVEIVAMAPGYRLHEERLQVGPDRQWVLVLDAASGALRITGELADPDALPTIERVAPAPRSYPLHFLRRWAMLHHGAPSVSGSLLIPGMPSGVYQMCPPPAAGNAAACASGSLSPNGELILSMPDASSGDSNVENEI